MKINTLEVAFMGGTVDATMEAFIRGAWRTFSDKNSQTKSAAPTVVGPRPGGGHSITADPTRSRSCSAGPEGAVGTDHHAPKHGTGLEQVKVKVETEIISGPPKEYVEVHVKREELPAAGLESGTDRRYCETGQDRSNRDHFVDEQVIRKLDRSMSTCLRHCT